MRPVCCRRGCLPQREEPCADRYLLVARCESDRREGSDRLVGSKVVLALIPRVAPEGVRFVTMLGGREGDIAEEDRAAGGQMVADEALHDGDDRG